MLFTCECTCVWRDRAVLRILRDLCRIQHTTCSPFLRNGSQVQNSGRLVCEASTFSHGTNFLMMKIHLCSLSFFGFSYFHHITITMIIQFCFLLTQVQPPKSQYFSDNISKTIKNKFNNPKWENNTFMSIFLY